MAGRRGGVGTLYDPTPPTNLEGYSPRLLCDANGRLFVILASNMDYLLDSIAAHRASIGTEGNLWNDQTDLALDATSATLDISNVAEIAIFGNVDKACEFEVLCTQDDGVNWYTVETLTVAGAGNFYFARTYPFKGIALRNKTATLDVTATLAGKS